MRDTPRIQRNLERGNELGSKVLPPIVISWDDPLYLTAKQGSRVVDIPADDYQEFEPDDAFETVRRLLADEGGGGFFGGTPGKTQLP